MTNVAILGATLLAYLAALTLSFFVWIKPNRSSLSLPAVVLVFVGGGLVGFVAGLVLQPRVADWLKPYLFHEEYFDLHSGMTTPRKLFAGQVAVSVPNSRAATLLHEVIDAGLIEETMKLFVVLALVFWRRDFTQPIQGLVYGIVAALGFGVTEAMYHQVDKIFLEPVANPVFEWGRPFFLLDASRPVLLLGCFPGLRQVPVLERRPRSRDAGRLRLGLPSWPGQFPAGLGPRKQKIARGLEPRLAGGLGILAACLPVRRACTDDDKLTKPRRWGSCIAGCIGRGKERKQRTGYSTRPARRVRIRQSCDLGDCDSQMLLSVRSHRREPCQYLLIGLLLASGTLDSRSAGQSDQPVPADWPQFRGPDGQGHANSRGLALTWSEKENIAWKVEIPGLAWSSPVIQGPQIWLTTALNEKASLRVLCLERGTGRTVNDVEVFAPKKLVGLKGGGKNSSASPTPLIEGDRVYVHFGQMGTACLSTAGKILWTTALPHTLYYGPSSTPVLFGDLLIVPCHGTDVRYTVALDKQTGKERWKTPHAGQSSDSTPLVIRVGDVDQLVCNLSGSIVAYDAGTGKELWSVRTGGYAQVPRPVYGHGLVFLCGGTFDRGPVQAIRPDGKGDVGSSHVAWRVGKHVPETASPLLVRDELYLVTEMGFASCLDARTGKEHWNERLEGAYSASPLFADGRIYFSNEDGLTTVIAPGKKFEVLATNRLDGRTMASLAVAGKEIYLRSDRHLYRIEKK